MNLPDHVESTQLDENQYILTNKITNTNIKIGLNELNFLCYLYSMSIGEKTYEDFNLTKSQQHFLQKRFKELGFFNKEIAINLRKKRGSKNLSRIPIISFDPERILNKISTFTKPLITMKFFSVIILLNFLSFIIFSFQREEWLPKVLTMDISISNIIIIYIMIIFTLIIHELSHAVTCHFFEGKVNEIGIMIFYFNFALYCDVSSIYAFKSKYKKIVVIMSGLISQTVIGSFSIILYYFSTSLGYNWDFLLYFYFLNWGVITLNLIPLIKLDGYWMLTQLVEIDNLRDKSFKYIMSIFISKYRELFLKSPSREIRAFKWYGWISIVFTTLLWIYSIYFVLKLTSHVNKWLSIFVFSSLILLVIIHFYKVFTSYRMQMNEELSVLQNHYYHEKSEI